MVGVQKLLIMNKMDGYPKLQLQPTQGKSHKSKMFPKISCGNNSTNPHYFYFFTFIFKVTNFSEAERFSSNKVLSFHQEQHIGSTI